MTITRMSHIWNRLFGATWRDAYWEWQSIQGKRETAGSADRGATKRRLEVWTFSVRASISVVALGIGVLFVLEDRASLQELGAGLIGTVVGYWLR